MDFTKFIQDEGAKLAALHAAIDQTVIHRDRDARSRREWAEACRAFHAYVSPLDRYFERARNEERYFDQALLEFAICFLEVDPWFFGSGHLKQILITRLKRSELRESDKRRLRRVLIDSVNRRGTREFRYYCRLAVILATAEFIKEVESACASTDTRRGSRARMMLVHIANHTRLTGTAGGAVP